jgi:autotransporter-associated beta strand protein
MKNNLLSKCTTLCDTPSNKKNTTRFNGLLALFLMVMVGGNVMGQTNPTAQSLPYTQNFSTFTGSTTTYPAGIQGWTIAGSLSTNYLTTAPNGDFTLVGGSNASTTAGVYDMNSKIGLICTGSTLRGICLSIVTTSKTNITLSYLAGTQAQISAGRINEIGVQYRVGTSGTFTNIAGSTYQNNATSTINTGTASSNTSTLSFSLPAACENQSVVQLRWIYRDVSGSGNRPSLSVDDITVSSAIPSISISNGTIAASSPNNGQTNVVLQRYDMAVTTADATLTGLTVTTAGTYAAADLTNLKVRYSTDATLDGADATLSTKTSSLAPGSQVFPSFTSQSITSGSTGYIFVTADIASGATNGNTINIATTAFSNITFSSGTKTGTDPVAAGGLQTITVATPGIALSSPGASASNITVGTTNNVIYRFDLAITTATPSLTGVTINTSTGSNVSDDLTNLKCWYSSDNTFSSGTDMLLSTKTTSLAAGSQVFPTFSSQSLTFGSTYYIFITADVPLTATPNNTIIVSAITTADLTFATGNKTGTANASGTKTIIDCTPADVTSPAASSISNSSVLTWVNPTCYDEIVIVASLTSNSGTPNGNGSAYTGNLVYGSGTALGNGFVVYKGSTSSQTVTGLTNGTQYFYKFFTRRGTTWTSGTEVSATPNIAGYYWNGASIAANPAGGGTGTWSTANSWRQPSATGAQATWADNNNAIFGGTAGSVTVDGTPRIATAFYFNTTGYELLTPTGTTTLTGPIVLANNVGLTFSPNVNVTTPASGTIGVGSISGTGSANITINSAQGSSSTQTQRINLVSVNSSISVPINIVSTGGTGALSIANIAATSTGTSLSSTATITNNTAIKTAIGATGGNDITVNGVISGSADLQFSAGGSGGAGTVTLNAANTYTGATIFNAANSGVIRLGIANALPTSTNVTMANSASNGGILDLNGFNQTIASLTSGVGGGSIRNNGVSSNATLTINGSTTPAAFALVIADGTSTTSLTRGGTGTTELTATNTYTGLTTVSGGTLRLNKSGGTTIPNTNNVTVDGGTLQISSNQTLAALTVTSGTVKVDAGVTLTIAGNVSIPSGANLILNGVLTSTGTRTLTIASSANVTIGNASGLATATGTFSGGKTFTDGANYAVSVATTTPLGVAISANNFSTTESITLNSALSITGTLSFGSVNDRTITTGSNLTLISTSSATASIADLTNAGVNSGNTITGNVTVERYIPAKRSWRAITAPVSTTTSIYANWQENGIGNTVNGFDIWNPNGGTGILTGGSGSSLLSYNSSSNTWTGITNTQATSTMMDGTKNRPFMAFVTGPNGSNNISSGATDTKIRATGTLLTGDQSYPTTSNKYTFIGNPYASPLDLTAVLNPASNATASFGGNVWIWDANGSLANAVGTYNLFDYAASNYSNTSINTNISGAQIQSGQAFFVKSTNGATFTIKESHKGSTYSNAVFRTGALPELLRVGLYKQVNNEWSGRDGAMTVILADADANQASNKMANGTENIAFTKNGASFASNHQLPLVASDVLNVKVWNTTAGANYKLKINTEEFTATNLSATLEDLFTNARTPLTLDGTAVEYPFTVTTDALSTGDRFRIVFQTSALGTTIPKANGFSIVPNPVTGDSFQVNLGSLATGTYSYSICNAIGQEVEKGSIDNASQNTNYTIKMNNSATGIYIMKIKGSDNSVFTAKIIKK